ncbi:MAG: glutamate-5-semialdehyde dehydrogenase [Planctomycetes bacterium]|nr:glutamate-5-semialdehyde dehydrogenase [Planctomycetota bacterium]
MSELHGQAVRLAASAKESAPALARAEGGLKNAALSAAADRLISNTKSILNANAKDLKAGKKVGLSDAMLDRLKLDKSRIEKMVQGLRQVAALPDPIGGVIDGWKQPNGLRLHRTRVPLGVVLIIFESRPNVTIDAAALCIKSGNAAILRGGKEAVHTNKALGRVLASALEEVGLPDEAVQVVESTDRALVPELLSLSNYIDVVVPRGGKGLIQAVMEHSRIPVIKHLDGICHVYIDSAADLDMARSIAINAKVQRPGVCNAMETLIVHKSVAAKFLPECLKALKKEGVEIRGDAEVVKLAKGVKVKLATEEDWGTEYLDLILSVTVVNDIDHAIRHINAYGSHHTDAIITRDFNAATRFKREVDSSSIMVNASTRFSDGFEYGLGAEIGISTDKLHARGPVGLEGLTTYKWIVEGEGQIRT